MNVIFVGMNIAAKKKKSKSIYDNEPEQKSAGRERVIFTENNRENADGKRGHFGSNR